MLERPPARGGTSGSPRSPERSAGQRGRAAEGGSGAEDVAAAATLAVSVVVYRPDLEMLARTLESLRAAVVDARAVGALRAVSLDLVDNGQEPAGALEGLLERVFGAGDAVETRVHRGHGNVGYGRGHNLSIRQRAARYHLVLNPDVLMEPDALSAAVRYMEANPDVGLLSPRVTGADGTLQYLVRERPTVLVLALRGFAPRPVRRLFGRYMARHELRPRLGDGDHVVRDVPCATGCFMFARGDVLRQVGGFSPAYFLYFEDFDLTMALAERAATAYVPTVRVCHFGGDSAQKGWLHIRIFIAGAGVFFRRHGWRLY